jgi:hypothetical protein
MKKIIIFLSLIICISFQVTGCTEQKTGNSTKKNQKIETTVKKTESDIREIAYQSLDQGSKNTILYWKGAKVEEYIDITDHSVAGPNRGVNIKGIDAYKITFSTTNEGILGPLTIYVDKNTFNVIGTDFRE